jgi:hypothetical protein
MLTLMLGESSNAKRGRPCWEDLIQNCESVERL